MNTYRYDRAQEGWGRYRGIALVVSFHIVLAWVLISGTAHRSLVLVKMPMSAQVIQEVQIAPPPPPKPEPVPKQRLHLPPKSEPPPFVPLAEVPVTQAAATQIEATALPSRAPADIAPPAPVVAEAAPVVQVAAPAKRDIALVCPTQVAPEMPRKALIDGIEGRVRAQALIDGGVVREVNILSGPRVFYAAVKTAMLQYKCARDSGVVTATQDFNFRFE